MWLDLRRLIDFVRTTEFPVVMAVAGGVGVTLLGVVVSHRFRWFYPLIGIGVGLVAAFVIRWFLRSVLDRL